MGTIGGKGGKGVTDIVLSCFDGCLANRGARGLLTLFLGAGRWLYGCTVFGGRGCARAGMSRCKEKCNSVFFSFFPPFSALFCLLLSFRLSCAASPSLCSLVAAGQKIQIQRARVASCNWGLEVRGRLRSDRRNRGDACRRGVSSDGGRGWDEAKRRQHGDYFFSLLCDILFFFLQAYFLASVFRGAAPAWTTATSRFGSLLPSPLSCDFCAWPEPIRKQKRGKRQEAVRLPNGRGKLACRTVA